MYHATVPIRAKRKKDDRPEPCLGEFAARTDLCMKNRRGGYPRRASALSMRRIIALSRDKRVASTSDLRITELSHRGGCNLAQPPVPSVLAARLMPDHVNRHHR